MKKKVIAAVMMVVLMLSAVVGGTFAYLTDTSNDVNTMALGKAEIDQLEKQQDENDPAGLEAFENNAPEKLVPSVKDEDASWEDPDDKVELPLDPEEVTGEGGNTFSDDDVTVDLWDPEKFSSVRDKMVFVNNTGTVDLYYRTLLLFEVGNNTELIHYNLNQDTDAAGSAYFTYSEPAVVTINGVNYILVVATYQKTLAVNELSRPSLLQVAIDEAATNEDLLQFKNGSSFAYDVLVLSQAVQAEGFSNAETALNTSFGQVTAEYIVKLAADGEFGTELPSNS